MINRKDAFLKAFFFIYVEKFSGGGVFLECVGLVNMTNRTKKRREIVESEKKFKKRSKTFKKGIDKTNFMW